MMRVPSRPVRLRWMSLPCMSSGAAGEQEDDRSCPPSPDPEDQSEDEDESEQETPGGLLRLDLERGRDPQGLGLREEDTFQFRALDDILTERSRRFLDPR